MTSAGWVMASRLRKRASSAQKIAMSASLTGPAQTARRVMASPPMGVVPSVQLVACIATVLSSRPACVLVAIPDGV